MRLTAVLSLLGGTAVFAQSGYDTPCTTTVTEMIPWGCTVTVGGQTATQTVDCKGCAMTTTSKINGLLGLGPVCIGGRSTMTDAKVIKTVTACALGTEGKAKKHHGGKEEVSSKLLDLSYEALLRAALAMKWPGIQLAWRRLINVSILEILHA